MTRHCVCRALLFVVLVSGLHAAGRKKVPQPPQIITHPEKEYGYREGSTGFSVELPCRARGEPEPEYWWTRDGQRLSTDAINIQMKPAEGTIIIERPSEEHGGTYQCFAKNDFGIALSSLAVLRRAYLEPFRYTSSQPRQHKPYVGDYLVLKCSPPKSYPEGVVSWSQVGGPKKEKKTVVTNDRIALDYEGNLHFANMLMTDSRPRDTYVCSLYNGEVKGTMDGHAQIVRVQSLDDQGNLHFINVIREDKGPEGSTYVCVVSNYEIRGQYQGSDQMVLPEPRQATPPFRAPRLRWSTKNPDTAIKGHTHFMKCIFSGYPTPKVTWERKGGKELPSEHSIDASGMELTIRNVKWEDAGMYACKAITPSMPNSVPVIQDFELTVESAPYFIRQMRDITASEEEDAEFECDASGVPKPSIQWSINGKPIGEADDNSRRTIVNGVVYYKNLTKADSQVLQCNATNKHGYIFKNVYLNVLAEAPSFIKAPEPALKVAEGQTINITCQVFGHPRPKISWLKEGQPIDDPRMSVKEDDEGETNGGNITIKGVLKADEGLYTCQAVNKFGNESESGRLIVREPTVISLAPKDTTVNATEDVTLNCEATTDEHEENKLTIIWLRDGEEIDYENEPRVSKNNQDNSLIIRGASVDDTAEYTCVASNGLDSDEQTVHVTVKDRPDPPKNVRLQSCVSNAEITWERGNENNEEVIEYIVYYNTSFDEPGKFHKAGSYGRGDTSARIELSPWTNYTFHVKARNALGISDRSNHTSARCETQPDIPYKNPENVCTDSQDPSELVITWDPMERIDHNGPGFHYMVHWRRTDIENMAPESELVDDWKTGRFTVTGQETFKKYEIYVQASNNQGPAPNNYQKMIGYSGEGTPKDSPGGFAIDEDSLNATSVIFTWDPVDESPDNIQGHFIGYEVVYWRADQPEDKRYHLVELNEAVNCKPAKDGYRRRARRQTEGDQVFAHILDLWPYSDIVAGVSVKNGKSSGELSPTIEFRTPEGAPSEVPMFEVRERGSHHFGVAWAPPLSPNGIITGYIVGWQESDNLAAPTQTKDIYDPFKRSTIIKNLQDNQDYRLYIWALTSAGQGKMMVIEDKTLVAGNPDKPGFADIEVGEQYVNVSWVPTDEEEERKNPGSEFYVEYRKVGDEEWEKSEPLEEDHRWTNISGLDFGEEYEIVIVAVNGAGQETRSDPKTVQVGHKAEKRVMSIARAGWFVGMMCAIAFLLLVLIIVCLIKRNRGGKYPVHEKEKLRGRDPDRDDDEERGFGEYTKTDEPDYKKSAGSLESESKPLDMSDSDSMAEYEDTDPSKFNEDGSFIGQYGGLGGKKTKSKEKIEPDATSPSALSTFV